MELSNIKNKLLNEQIEDQILEYIIKNSIPVGGKLPNEFKLAEMFEVGRSTIREAVKLLISKGILEIRRGAGTYILNTATKESDPLGLNNIDDKKSLALDLVEVRLMLEPEIACKAAINATEEDIEILRKLCTKIEEKIESGESYIQEDIRFHAFIAECSKNKVLEQLIPIIDTAVLMFVNVTHNQLIKETVKTHRNIVEAISERDFIGARTAMTMHLTYNRNLIKRLLYDQ